MSRIPQGKGQNVWLEVSVVKNNDHTLTWVCGECRAIPPVFIRMRKRTQAYTACPSCYKDICAGDREYRRVLLQLQYLGE